MSHQGIRTVDVLSMINGKCLHVEQDEGVTISEYELLSDYGQGTIKTYCFLGVEICISDFKLHNDIIENIHINLYKLQLSYLLVGEKIISLKNFHVDDIVCESGHCYMAKIDEVTGQVRISSKKRYKEIKIRIAPEFFKALQIDNPLTGNTLLSTKLVVPITNDLLKVLSELDNHILKGINRKLFLSTKVFELLMIQMGNYEKQISTSSTYTGNIATHVYLTRHYILNHMEENFSVRELAQKAGVNNSMLRNGFKRIFGCSINEFSRNAKMDYAKNMLKNTELTIYEIAENIGYKNATHFSAAFKKYVGVTPKKYRL